MATSWTSTSGVSAELWPEELGLLAGGPGRATEVAVVSLVEAGALRISRDGLVSAVHGPARSWTPLQSFVLRSTPRPLGELITAGAGSGEAQALRESLIARGYVRTAGAVTAVRWLRRLFILGWFGLVLWSIFGDLEFPTVAAGFAALVVVLVGTSSLRRPLTRAGRQAVRRLRAGVVTSDRLPLVAYYGLLGRVGGQYVWQILGIDPVASTTLRRRRSTGSGGSASCGSGCGSCSSSSCSSSSSDSGSSSSDSGSSCGSSCGGGCGGGGGD